MQLHDALELVTDPASFLTFARLLIADRIEDVEREVKHPSPPFGRSANGWENGSIEGFLEAAVSWAESTELGLKQGLTPDNPWKQFATFLYCGKIYE